MEGRIVESGIGAYLVSLLPEDLSSFIDARNPRKRILF